MSALTFSLYFSVSSFSSSSSLLITLSLFLPLSPVFLSYSLTLTLSVSLSLSTPYRFLFHSVSLSLYFTISREKDTSHWFSPSFPHSLSFTFNHLLHQSRLPPYKFLLAQSHKHLYISLHIPLDFATFAFKQMHNSSNGKTHVSPLAQLHYICINYFQVLFCLCSFRACYIICYICCALPWPPTKLEVNFWNQHLDIGYTKIIACCYCLQQLL